jgi:hypothetical protein
MALRAAAPQAAVSKRQRALMVTSVDFLSRRLYSQMTSECVIRPLRERHRRQRQRRHGGTDKATDQGQADYEHVDPPFLEATPPPHHRQIAYTHDGVDDRPHGMPVVRGIPPGERPTLDG